MTDISNWLNLGLSQDQEKLVQDGAALYKATYLDTIDNIFVIAKAIEILRTANYGTGVQGSFAEALVQYGFTNRDGGGPMNKALRSHFKTLLDNEKKVRAWWDGVDEKKKRYWVSVKAIYSNWQASMKPKTAKPPATRPEQRAEAKVEAEMRAAPMPHQHNPAASATTSGQPAAAPSEKVSELRKQLAQANAEIKELQGKNMRLVLERNQAQREAERMKAGGPSNEVLGLQDEIKSLRGQVAAWKAKAQSKPPPNPSEIEAKLNKKIRELRGRLRSFARADKKTTIFMTKADNKKLQKVFHPDAEAGVTAERKAQLTAAFQIYSGLKIEEVDAD